MALPSEVEEYGATRAVEARKQPAFRTMRIAFVTSAIFAAMVATVMLSGAFSSNEVEMEISTPEAKLTRLVEEFAKHGDTMSVAQMTEQLDAWRHNPETLLDLPSQARMQMLADFHSKIAHPNFMALASNSKLCAKKDWIIDKFEQLLKKLGGQELLLNVSHSKVNKEYEDALSAWLASESSYRLTMDKTKQAKEGAVYAKNQFEKYQTAHKAAQKSEQELTAAAPEELNDLNDERELILEIMRMLGVLNAVNETQTVTVTVVKKVENPEQLKANIQKLVSLTRKVKMPRMSNMLAQLKTSLARYAETDEIMQILQQMLEDIEDRVRILTQSEKNSASTVKQLDTKMVDWETKLVTLADASDKSQAASESESLDREQLAGKEKALHKTAEESNAAYKLTISPYLKEIYVIKLIEKKVIDHCTNVTDASQ